MNFQLTGTGHSFKGSMAYYLTDKRQEGQEQPQTADRVEWTETRNLATDGPHTATRIMIATAQQADELKRAAGVKNTGRKATGGPVFAFSLAWHPSEAGQIDRAEMSKAADHALKVLGLDHLQSVIVAHRDTAHPHVHVIVNRVDPTNGKTTPIRKPAVLELDKWADRYERERGQIVSPNRAKKHDEQERKRKAHPDPEKRKKYAQDREAARKKDAAATFQSAADPKPAAARAVALAQPVATDKTPAAMLKELGDAQKARHRQEWAKLAADQKTRRTAIYEAAGRHIKRAVAEAKEQNRPLWSDFFRQQRDERQRFEARERSLAGIVRNCIAAAKIQERRGDPSNPRGFLTMAFAYVGSRDARRQAFTGEQERARQELAAATKARTDQRISQIKAAQATTSAKARQIMTAERAALVDQQNTERAKLREAWRQLNLQRGRTPPRQQQENDTMLRQRYAAAANPDGKTPTRAPMVNWELADTPAPALTPAGISPPTRTAQPVPQIDRAADWAKSEQGRAALAKDAPAPPARQQFGKTAEPKPEPQKQAPAAEPTKAQSRADYWNDRAKAADRPKDQTRDRSLDRDFDRER